VADGGEDDVGGIALAALQVAAAEVTIGLHVTDHGLDGGAAPIICVDRHEVSIRIDYDSFDVEARKKRNSSHPRVQRRRRYFNLSTEIWTSTQFSACSWGKMKYSWSLSVIIFLDSH
jgi:hypothetical protein